jgi:peptidoglycan-associated lipoprotein
MMHRLTITLLVAVLVTGGAMACGGKSEPEGPTPAELEQMRQDSIQRAEEARRDSIQRAEEQRRQEEMRRQEQLRRETAEARAIIEEMIHFAYDRSELRSEAQETLRDKVGVMRANPDLRIRIAGHADERGSIEYNRALGQRRAEAAKDFLVGFGISPDRINTVSFGEDRPLVNASNEEAWAMNRRDEFDIIAGGDQLRLPGGP